jgi:hypothetical protein
VKTECVADAMRLESGLPPKARFGFRGGLTPEERAKLDPKAARTAVGGHALNGAARKVRNELYEGGALDAEIADATGVHINRVRAWRSQNRLPGNPGEAISDPGAARMSLWESGMNDREIGELVGVDQSAVAAWRNRLGLPANAISGGKLTPLGQEPDNRHALYQQGLTDKEIGAACRINHDSVRKWRMKHELPPNGGTRVGYAERIEKASEMLRAGSSTGEIARALGVTEGAVRNLKVALRLRGVAS